jgi:hypothetical protein
MNDAEHMTMPWEVREILTGSGEVRWDIVTDDDVRWYVCRAYTGLRGDYTGEATARLICKEHNAALKAKKGGKAKAKAAKGVHITLLESALKQQTEECERLRRIIKFTLTPNAEAHGRRSRTVQPLVGSLDGDK